ncbi:hypothetical protein [Amycolatopsis sp.]|uniref:hypothetical protein n=1 Tax=Amycolatopsis sp. TaxID=37632 RepID=UPI002CDB816E|nr:hypothetical protein [Amycolatopsis sp.]HVV12793.1 hypothetical protein [Amycolatopsis sp.]
MAVAVGAGYLLGRTKKMRLALMIAAAGATGRAGTSPQALLRNGLKELGASAELGKVTDIARDQLLGAAKAAAVTAASSRIEALNARIQDGAGKRSKDREEEPPAEDEADDENENEDAAEEAEQDDEEERPARRRGSRSRKGDDEDAAEDVEQDDEEERPARRRASRSSRSRKDDNEDNEEDEEPERPVRRRATGGRRRSESADSAEPARRTRSASRRAPVRRAGR